MRRKWYAIRVWVPARYRQRLGISYPKHGGYSQKTKFVHTMCNTTNNWNLRIIQFGLLLHLISSTECGRHCICCVRIVHKWGKFHKTGNLQSTQRPLWALENPHGTRTPFFSVNVLVGIVEDHLIPSYFLPHHLDDWTYIWSSCSKSCPNLFKKHVSLRRCAV